MSRPRRDGFLRRLGKAVSGTNAIEYGRPVPVDDPAPPSGPVPTLVVDDPYDAPSTIGSPTVRTDAGTRPARPDPGS